MAGRRSFNLACIYAVTGEINKSIQQLDKALKLNPELKEWAGQDSDLDSIREDPAYKVLIDSKE